MEIIAPLYFSVFIFSILVLVDLMLKFKRPLILKFHFSMLVIAMGGAAFVHYLNNDSGSMILFYTLTKAVSASALMNIFSILYYPKYKLIVNIFSFAIVLLAISVFFYSLYFENICIPSSKQNIIMVVPNEGLDFPWPIRILRLILVLSFYSILFYFIYGIIKKYQYNNIYFDKIKKWTSFILIFCLGLLVLYLPLSLIRNNPDFGNIINVVFYFYILLVVFYRPNFLNKSALKISFGDNFSKDADYAISELDFINEFYTHSYFTRNDASLENLAKIMNISSNDLYKFIYYKYTMTFNDLVNKNRVEYFIDIIHNSKYLNYTIDALAKEAGFSSRQHLYKPFKKFHGGNPSDIVDAISS